MDNSSVQLKSCELFKISDEPEQISSFTRILYNKEVIVEEEDVQSKPKSLRICFNCEGEDHSLRECTKPYNQKKIARNRGDFNSRSANKMNLKLMEFTRYHKEIDDRFSEFRPGKISDQLKDALGLKKDALPRYIYNMRGIGYPPGWLEEAKITNSGINMLDSNGERVPDPDEEEGEICSVRVRYDPSKIIDYPGFNVWPDPGTINETEIYGSLPMCHDQRKEVFIKQLNDSNNTNDNTIVLDDSSEEHFYDAMDVEKLEVAVKMDTDKASKCRFIPPLPDETEQASIPPPPPPPPEDLSSSNDDDAVVEGSEGEKESSEEEEGELRSSQMTKLRRNQFTEKNSSNKSSEMTEESFKTSQCESDDCSPSKRSKIDTSPTETVIKFGSIKSVELGTPVVNHSSYTALPSPEKFRKDISDVIYFENLPNSTGKYERLKGVLKNVRAKLGSLRGNAATKK